MVNLLVQNINNALYTYLLIIMLVGCGVYFTVRTRFVQVRLLKQQIKAVTERPKDRKGVSSFQALMVSTASRVGTGNIIGVSTALCLGGYGSVFWMWAIAIIGSASAFIESTLAQIYKRKSPEGWCGGPAYYIETALHSRGLAVAFSVCLILTYGVGFNMLASYNLQSTFSSYSFYHEDYSPWIIGLILAFAVAYCLFGGGKRVIKTTSFLVPIMGIIYIAVAMLIVVINIQSIPVVLKKIMIDAFHVNAIFGGFSGSCLMYGIKRGLFSNEAGVGSAPNASATAEVSHPIQQGLVQILSVFLDTLVVCSATAFLCMCSGIEPKEELSGAPYIQLSLQNSLGGFGAFFITFSMIFFAFTTLLGNLYYVDQSLFFLFRKKPEKRIMRTYYLIASLVIFIGAGLNADLLWGIADITMGAMAMINIPVILILSKYVIRALKNYEEKIRRGEKISFHAVEIQLPHELDGWK